MTTPAPTARDPLWLPPSTSRRRFLRDMVAGTLGSSLAACAPRRDLLDRPNIVVMLADDLGIDAVGCYGAESIETPRLDALAAQGLRFQNCYSTPLCTPSRVQFLTGRYPFRSGWTDNMQSRLEGPENGMPPVVDPAERTFAHVLKQAGYVTAVAGKWQLCVFEDHPDHPHQLGFDDYLLWQYMRRGESGELEVSSRYWLPSVFEDGKESPPRQGVYGPDLYCAFLIDFMKRHRDRPFLAYYPMILPHPPFEMTPRELDPARVDKEPSTDPSNYRRMVVYMDQIVGRMQDAIVDLGIAERTVFLFLSDNGTPENVSVRYRGVSRTGGKGSMTEAGMRVPLLAWWPGQTNPGKIRTDLVDLSDFLPTFAELAGAAVPTDRVIDGRSFARVLQGKGRGPREWIYSQLRDAWCVRNHRYKLYDDERLFDLVEDREEQHNLFGEPSARSHRLALAEVYQRLRA